MQPATVSLSSQNDRPSAENTWIFLTTNDNQGHLFSRLGYFFPWFCRIDRSFIFMQRDKIMSHENILQNKNNGTNIQVILIHFCYVLTGNISRYIVAKNSQRHSFFFKIMNFFHTNRKYVGVFYSKWFILSRDSN